MYDGVFQVILKQGDVIFVDVHVVLSLCEDQFVLCLCCKVSSVGDSVSGSVSYVVIMNCGVVG